MQKLNVQTSLSGVYDDVRGSMEENPGDFLAMLKDHIKIESLIPKAFYEAYYKATGKPRDYRLESLLWFCQLQNIIGIADDSVMLRVLKISTEVREFCGFDSVPDISVLTKFRKDFVEYLGLMFNNLVEITEPVCREIDPKKADYLLYDTTGVKANVSENNPKFLESKLAQAKTISKKNPEYDPYKGVYALLPETAKSNPFVKHQFINGHFCYAHKSGLLTNGLGIVRGIYLFDERFKYRYPDIVSQKTDNPDLDKEISDSASLRPVLSEFFSAHPKLSYKTFIADSSFDSYDIYKILHDDFKFNRMCIPINPRNSKTAHTHFDVHGTPVCPLDKTPFSFHSISGGKNRSKRFKWVCHKSIRVHNSSKRVCICDTPCTSSSYGRCVYTYPHKNLRFYPGIPRATEHFKNLYRHRTLIERTINIFKDYFGISRRRAFSVYTAKADLFNAGITQLLGVLLAKSINQLNLFKSVRKLIAA